MSRGANEKDPRAVGLPPAVAGAGWMMLAGVAYTLTGTMVRIVSADYPIFEVVFIRSTIAVLLMAPLVLRIGVGALKTQQPGMHLLRASVGYVGILCWFYGVARIPLSDYFALQFTQPLFSIAGAALVLRERVGRTAWIAVVIGFCGALVILRPGIIEVSLGALSAVGAAFCFASVNVMIRVMSRKDSAVVIVAYANFIIIPLSLVPALFDWVPVAWADWPAVLSIGLFGTLGQFSLTRAVGGADARVVQPFDFARLPFAALVGWLIFRELSDVWTWVGAVIIFSAGYFVLVRESRDTSA